MRYGYNIARGWGSGHGGDSKGRREVKVAVGRGVGLITFRETGSSFFPRTQCFSITK